jgi:hypothetical protein
MDKHLPSRSFPLRLFLFFAALPLAGIGLAYWFGLGWFFLFVALRAAVTSLPGPRQFVLSLLFGTQLAGELGTEIDERRGAALRASLALPTLLMYLALAAVVFWKFNVPLHEVVTIILGAP